MDYHLENLDDSEFEKLVNTICQKLLGVGVITFSPGRDGGRDGKFTGTAEQFPSAKDSWKGKFIIQSKHTSNSLSSCSDKEFEVLVDKEIIKIKAMKDNDEVDNYLLFTNRKFSGDKGEKLLKKIKTQTGLQNVEIIGREVINDQYLNPNKEIVRQYGLHLRHIPFDFSDEEIRDIILAFKKQLPLLGSDIKLKVDEIKYDFSHIQKDKKNSKNKLGEEYYKQHVLGDSLMDFDKIETFLNDPVNEHLKDFYYDTAHELNQLITLKRNDFEGFEELFVYIYQIISNGAISLKGAKRHVTTFLHYMYVECLIGKK